MIKLLVSLVQFTAVLSISACGEKGRSGGAAGGDWVGEAYASAGRESTLVGEFGFYKECLTASMEAAKSGVCNCGIK